jgi:hypothetical protein
VEVGAVINSGLQYMDAEGPYLTREQYYDLLKQFGFNVKPFVPDPKNMPKQLGTPQTSQGKQDVGGGKKDE